ncbi:MAG: hypothetical protein WBP44_14620 [Gammaproteobacteria bacterium]|jgi:hypothetical protein
MKHFLDNRIHGLWSTFHHNRQQKALRLSRMADVLNTVESVVDGTDRKIRVVPGYKKKLQKAIESSLEFADDLVNQIPASIEVSRSSFATDPYVNAFFTNVSDLRSIFSHSSEIQDFMDDYHDNSTQCCALLCMERTEKTVMGMELSGDMLKKDVLQVAVSFADHRIYSPAPTEPETREGLKHCLFQGLVSNALERIGQLRLASHHLQSQYQMLHARLRRCQQKSTAGIQDARMDDRVLQTMEETRRELVTIEKKILHTPRVTPLIVLEQVEDVFSKPHDFVRLRKSSLRLNKMGIRISDDSPQPGNQLNLTEVMIGDERPRVVTLATFPKNELIPRTAFSVFRNPEKSADLS